MAIKQLFRLFFSALIFLASIIIFKQKSTKEVKLDKEMIRPASVANTFYPGEAKALKSKLEKLLAQSPTPHQESLIRLIIVPHAGYDYSGLVAGQAYGQIKNQSIKRVVLLGTSHQQWFDGVNLDENDSWQTPLGKVKLDRITAAKLINEKQKIVFSSSPHLQEHSLEVQLPFLQTVLSDQFQIIPLLLGNTNEETINELVNRLFSILDEKTLIVVSSDLSHYPDYDLANEIDQATIKAILAAEPEKFQALVNDRAKLTGDLQTRACASQAIYAAMILAQKLKGRWELLKYANSGDATGDKDRVVGYGAIVFRESASTQKEGLSKEQQDSLLRIARESLKSHLEGKGIPKYEISDPALEEKLGVFVTLNKNKQLRGCMGNFSPQTPLWQTIQKQIIISATEDPRFPPIKLEEMEEIEIEISVLSEPEKIDDWRKIELGKHGVILKTGSQGGTFLPQVATDTGWDLETFLSQLCSQKAGLAPDCYKNPEAEIFVYTAQVFKESI